MNLRRLFARASLTIAGLSVLATLVIGVAHTPWARPLLKLPIFAFMANKAGCPIGPIAPDALEHVRIAKLKGDVGSRPAHTRVALEFVMGSTMRSDVERWAQQHPVNCVRGVVETILECDGVPAAGGSPGIKQLRLQFDAAARLVSVDLFREAASAPELFSHFQSLVSQLDRQVGPATDRVGVESLDYVTEKPLRSLARTYSYDDYVAEITLINFRKRGLKLREQYRWLPPGGPSPGRG